MRKPGGSKIHELAYGSAETSVCTSRHNLQIELILILNTGGA